MQKILIIFCLLFLFGCNTKKPAVNHIGKPFMIQAETSVAEIEKRPKAYLNKKYPVRFKGYIKYYDKVLGQWAFIETAQGLIFVDFSATTPNIGLTKRPISNEIIFEGYLMTDDTVLNGYALVPYGYEYNPENK